MLFPERVQLEQHSNVHEAKEGNANTASDGGLKQKCRDLTGSSFNSAGPDGPECMSGPAAQKKWAAPVRTPSPRK